MKTVITSEYEALFRQHFRLATLYAERIVGSAHEAEDIVQEVFIALLDVDFSQIRQKESYLYRCVRNAALDHLHARMKNRFYDINSKETVRLAAEENAPGDEQAMIEQIAAIYRRIEALPEQGRRIFKMICIEHKSYVETARLLEIDPIRARYPESIYTEANVDKFYDYRYMHLNYFAVKALLARVCMWEGSDENKHTALLAALEVIDDPASVGIAGGLTLRTFTDSAKAPTTEMCFPSEHIFALGVTDMAKKIASNLNREYSAQDRQYRTLCIKNSVADDLFEIKGAGISDCRYKQLYHNTDYWPEGTKTPSKLYQQTSTGADYRHKDLMPLIRLPEMYYIAAECRISGPDKDLGEARSLLQEVRKARAVYEELDADLDEAGLMAQLEKEYRKEFICEGVVFYFYKRLGYEKLPRQSDVMSGSKVIDDAVYMLPYPDFEIQSGRVQ